MFHMFWSRFNVRRNDGGGDGSIDGQRKHASKTIDPTEEIVILRLKNSFASNFVIAFTMRLFELRLSRAWHATVPSNGMHETQV